MALIEYTVPPAATAIRACSLLDSIAAVIASAVAVTVRKMLNE
jgi:hypothetical protein